MRTITNINKNWRFTKQGETTTVDLPHTWNAIDGQDGGDDYWRGQATYAKTLTVSKDSSLCYFLECRGCGISADVALNGVTLAHHDGGYSTFRVELTDGLRDGDNELVITADNSVNDRVYPQKADFTFYGGLYRDVYLITVPKTHFELVKDGTPGLRVTPICKGEDYEVTVDTWQNGGKVRITVNGETQTVDSSVGLATATFLLRKARLWDGLKDPYLYEAKAELLDEAGQVLDQVSTRFGCRTYTIDPQKGFLLNGRSYPLRGVSRHQDRKGVGNALTLEMHREDFFLIKEMGANSIRLAHYQHAQEFYDLCDEYGMVAWAEIPYISAHMENGRENTFSQMRELITQNYNHPAVVVWGLSNEITMQGTPEGLYPNHVELNKLCHKMDPTRPTVTANVMMLSIDDPLVFLPDTTAYNIYFGWYVGELKDNDEFFDRFHAKYPNTPMGFTEYGCDTNPAYHTAEPQRGDYTEEYQRLYHEHILELIEARPWLWCTYAWNMFDFAADARDEGGTPGVNQKGLVTMDRKLKKDVYYLYKAHWSQDPFVYLTGRRYVDRTEDVTDVTVYTNQGEVELFVDGKSFGVGRGLHKISFQVPITGEHTIEVRSGSLRDSITIRHVDQPNPAYKLVGGGILNWFDADGLKEGYWSLEDRICDLMKNPEVRKTVLDCVNRPAQRESEFLLDLRAHPEKLDSLEVSFNEMLTLSSPFISANIRRHINAALQQIRKDG